jgi:double-stranded uracil-DNA glycosylase
VAVLVSVGTTGAGPLWEGAGFAVTELSPPLVRAVRLRTLPDIVAPGMRLLVCGLNPSLYSADAGVPYARPGNRLWPAALAAGVVSVDRDPWHALVHHGVGWTDLAKRATVGAAELTADEYRLGAERLAWTVRLLRPGAVCFVGLTGYRTAFDRGAVAGPVPAGFAGVATYLMPSSSGLNAHTTPAALAEHLRAAMSL